MRPLANICSSAEAHLSSSNISRCLVAVLTHVCCKNKVRALKERKSSLLFTSEVTMRTIPYLTTMFCFIYFFYTWLLWFEMKETHYLKAPPLTSSTDWLVINTITFRLVNCVTTQFILSDYRDVTSVSAHNLTDSILCEMFYSLKKWKGQ